MSEPSVHSPKIGVLGQDNNHTSNQTGQTLSHDLEVSLLSAINDTSMDDDLRQVTPTVGYHGDAGRHSDAINGRGFHRNVAANNNRKRVRGM